MYLKALKKSAEKIENGIFINNLSKISKENNISIITWFAEEFEDKIYNSEKKKKKEI